MKRRSIKVLLIEDNPRDAHLARMWLSGTASVGWDMPVFNVEWVNKLAAALEQLRAVSAGERDAVDVVLTDLDLPDSQADETFATLRRHFPHLPIVVLTGREDAELARSSVRAGAQDYLFKNEAAGSLLAHALVYAIERQENAQALQKAHEKLEQRVATGAQELQRANAELNAEIAERRQTEKRLKEALAATQQRESETGWLLDASQAVLECHTFEQSARRIFDAARQVTGATSGYIALMSENGEENEVLFLESGGLPCNVDPDLPMPIRGLRAEAYDRAEVVYDNDFADSRWVDFLPLGHVELHNVMFAPLTIHNQVVGVMGLANKPSDFTPDDARFARAFGDMAAIALRRVRAEDALRESYERYQTILRTIEDGYFEVDLEGNFTFFNEAMAKIIGYAEKEMLGLNYRAYMSQATAEGVYQAFNRVYRTGKPNHGFDWQLVSKGGGERWVSVSIVLMRAENGSAVGFQGIARDITARIGAEKKLERYAAALERSNRELEQFAYVASHDLQEPVRLVKSYLKLLYQRCQDKLDEETDSFINSAIEGTERMQEMIRALLDLARLETRGQEFTATDCNTVLQDALTSLALMIEESEAQVTYDPLPTVMAEQVQLRQVFQNLVANGIKFRRKEVRPHVHISANRQGEEWLFRVQDNGIGIDPQQTERVFQIFRRLHNREDYPGIGIGLALCKRIVERHGGCIRVESEPGTGSTFYFTVPS